VKANSSTWEHSIAERWMLYPFYNAIC
jgi:hypothetical protein